MVSSDAQEQVAIVYAHVGRRLSGSRSLPAGAILSRSRGGEGINSHFKIRGAHLSESAKMP